MYIEDVISFLVIWILDGVEDARCGEETCGGAFGCLVGEGDYCWFGVPVLVEVGFLLVFNEEAGGLFLHGWRNCYLLNWV